MKYFPYTKPKLKNNKAAIWVEWFEYGEYSIDYFDLVPIDRIKFDEWNPQRSKDLIPKMQQGVPLDPVRLSLSNGWFTVGDGNHRVAVSKKMGFTHVPAIISRIVKKKPDFPPPPEIDEELLKLEASRFIQKLRNESGAELFWVWSSTQKDSYLFDVDVGMGALEEPFTLSVKAEKDMRELVLKDSEGKSILRIQRDKNRLQGVEEMVVRVLKKLKGSEDNRKIAKELLAVAKELAFDYYCLARSMWREVVDEAMERQGIRFDLENDDSREKIQDITMDQKGITGTSYRFLAQLFTAGGDWENPIYYWRIQLHSKSASLNVGFLDHSKDKCCAFIPLDANKNLRKEGKKYVTTNNGDEEHIDPDKKGLKTELMQFLNKLIQASEEAYKSQSYETRGEIEFKDGRLV
jgi:hypothetical protein